LPGRGLGWAEQARRGRRSWPYWHVPGASALAEARERLGPEPLRVLLATAARPLATQATRGAWYRRWRLLVLDGTCLEVPDSPANPALGRATSGRGEGWVRSPGAGGGAGGGGPARDRRRRPGPVCDRGADAGARTDPRGGPLGPGVLLLADRLVTGAELWRAMARTGADLVWRVKCGSKTAPKLPVDQVLADGSWRSRLEGGSDRQRRHPITVRVIEYTLAGAPAPTATGW
jgi:hypothetical protein